MSFFKKYFSNKPFAVAVGLSLVVALYWAFWASDRFVSESHVVIQRSDLTSGQAMDFSSMLMGMASSSKSEQLLLRDYLLSVDMLKRLDQKLQLRKHYSDTGHDVFSRLWSETVSIEWFYQYYKSRVQVELDEYAGVLVIKAQAYDPKMAQAVSSALVQEGERYMNALAQKNAQEQVNFLETQVSKLSERALLARRKVLGYQDRHGLVAPQATAENAVAVVNRLEAQKSELQAQRRAMQAYLVDSHPNVVLLNQQIAALEAQISQEQSKLASTTTNPLNKTVEEYQRLEMDATFALELYKSSLSALEKGRIEATRALKKVFVIQEPSLPEYALEPRRFYNSLLFIVVALLLAGVANLMIAVINDHKD